MLNIRIMKKEFIRITLFVIPILAFALVSNTAFAQDKLKSEDMRSYFYVQPNLGVSQYFGDLNQKDYWSQDPQIAGSIIFGYQLSPVFGVRAQSMKTVLYSKRTDQNKVLISDMWDNALHLTINVNEVFSGYNYLRLLNFYLYTGGGVSTFKSYLEVADPRAPLEKHAKKQNSFFLPVGAGMSIRLSNVLSVNLEYCDRTIFYPTKLDFTDGGHKNNDHYSYASAGIQIKFGSKDSDNDGVRDKDDPCPETAGKFKLSGCPDKDNDGVADKDDACPDIAGKAEFKGCPDTDDDGIIDSEDACPGIAGTKALQGCPDKDNDGVADKDDKCPDVAGIKELSGCPDRDGDGIADNDDACPDVKGLAQFNGCPDTDGDGIPDNIDKCPDSAGVVSNAGCPEIVAGPMLQKTVYFDQNKSAVLVSNLNLLDEVVTFMNNHPEVSIKVSGYASELGSDQYNLRLSEKRADDVINYLKKKGVSSLKIEKLFFGKDKPVGDNSTAEGRALNRRVEITIAK